MIDAITPISVVSSYTKRTDKEVELHRHVSINENPPQHFIHYILYDSKGSIDENIEPSIDIKV